MLSAEICEMKSLGPGYLNMHLEKKETEVSQFFINTTRQMTEEMKLNKGSHK